MKKIALLLLCFVFASTVFSQLPFVNYQGVARNASGQPLANQVIGVKSTIIADFPAANTTHYIEFRSVTTNQFGLFSFQIGHPTGATVVPLGGAGVPPGTEYFVIPWEKLTNTRLVTAISTNGGSSFTDLGTSALTNVPFANVANYAKVAAPWTTAASTNTIMPDLASWKLGLGTNNATEKLHVVGKIRMLDGNEGLGKVLTSDLNGVASWKSLTENSNFQWLTTEYPVTPIGPTVFLKGKKISLKPSFFEAIGGQTALNKFLTIDINDLDTFKVQAVQNISTSTKNIFTIRSNGDAGAQNQYPMLIDGSASTLGMAINLSGGVPNERKYIGFFGDGGIKGRIEGQTADDLVLSRPYIMFNFFHTVLLAEYSAEGVAAGLQLDLFEVAVNAVAATAMGVEWFTEIGYWQAEAGIAYESGSGDYAEWLERANPSEKFSASDIVEVIGGKISKTITGKGQLMVISMAPIVLGNMPEPGKEKLSEKVAFMGQVPVKVFGDVAIGDYIISSGNNDGIGYAVHPAAITPEEYKRMVGVAWSKSSGKLISLINTAVGLQTPAVVDMVKKQEEKLAAQTTQINQLGTYLAAKDPSFKFEPVAEIPSLASHQKTVMPVATPVTTSGNDRNKAALEAYKTSLTAAKVKKLLEDHPEEFTKTWKSFQETVLQMSKSKTFDLDKNPEVKRLVYDRDAYVNNIKKAYGLL